MRRLRTASSPRLLALVAVLVAVVAGAGIAQAALTGAQKPAPKALDRAVLDAVNAPRVDGVTAHIEFTNNLLPSGSLPRDTASPTLTGATGRLWLAKDGRVRLELQSDAGDVQVVWNRSAVTIFDASSNTFYRAKLPTHASAGAEHSVPTVARIREFLANLAAHADVSGAEPGTVGGQAAYTVRVSPKHDGGLLGAGQLA